MINSQTIDTSTPAGTGIPRTYRGTLLRRCVRTGGHESTDEDETCCATVEWVCGPVDSSPTCGRSLRAQRRQ